MKARDKRVKFLSGLCCSHPKWSWITWNDDWRILSFKTLRKIIYWVTWTNIPAHSPELLQGAGAIKLFGWEQRIMDEVTDATCKKQTHNDLNVEPTSSTQIFEWLENKMSDLNCAFMPKVMSLRRTELMMVMYTQLCAAFGQFLTLSIPAVVTVTSFTVFTKVGCV